MIAKLSPVCFFNRISATTGKFLFTAFFLLKERLFCKRKLKILFSDHPGLKQNITKGFRFSKHQITFAELTPAHIANSDLIVPLYIRDLKYLNDLRSQIENNHIPIPNKESIALCDDKWAFNQAMIASGFNSFIPKIGGHYRTPIF